MAVDRPSGVVLLLRMVRSEDARGCDALLARLRERFPGQRLVWATTPVGAQVLRDAGCPVEVAHLPEGVPSPGALRDAAGAMRSAAPATCVVAYENARRRGNLSIEILALLARAPVLCWTTDGTRIARLSRLSLIARVAGESVQAVALALGGLLAGGVVALLLPCLGLFGRTHGAAHVACATQSIVAPPSGPSGEDRGD